MRTEPDGQAGLFDVPELQPLPNAGRAEAGVTAALQKAVSEGVVIELDAGLVAGALIAARALDGAETIRDQKDRAYAVTALLPPFQRALHGLRLPAETSPAGEARLPDPAPSGPQGPSWLSDELGPS